MNRIDLHKIRGQIGQIGQIGIQIQIKNIPQIVIVVNSNQKQNKNMTIIVQINIGVTQVIPIMQVWKNTT